MVPTLATYEALHRHGRDRGFPEVSLQKLDVVREAGLRSLEILKSAGVRMGLGTDLLGELHRHQLDEFEIRARVLPAHEILNSATSVNAEILNRSGELGVVAPGALADLIVVDGDPVKDITVLGGEGGGIVLVIATIHLATAIITEATLSFLGVGVPPTKPSLGTLIRVGNDFLFSGEWWITVFPGAALVILVLAVNLLGDWLRDALNPKLR